MENIRQQITDQIVAAIEAGTPPWRKGWSSPELHKNGLTQASYRGVNQVILAMTPYTDSRWLTWKQAETLGVKVKRGSKGHRIVKMVEVDRSRAASVQEGEVLAEDKGKALIMKGYVVFNAEQIEGLPDLPRPTNKVEPVAAVDALIEGMKGTGLTVLYGGGQPAYAPLTDTVKMPLPDRFHTTQDYAATMLHELAHASGNKKRLDRLNLYARFGSEEYSREELVAELSSAFLGAQLGMPMAASMMESHASYMASWLTVLKRDKNEIFRAAAEAQKIADYLAAWAPLPDLGVCKEPELNPSMQHPNPSPARIRHSA
ncbi:zincin-like metallopeptidase domain-containing protein [Polaromonas sp. YR568]|uniref:ArdC family protein n=1 Tax=Polaromonas sp. YR568 TaxID=1855301 RepID=UPI0031379759